MEHQAFVPKDPFQLSLRYSLQNIFLWRKIPMRHPQRLSDMPYPSDPWAKPTFYPHLYNPVEIPRFGPGVPIIVPPMSPRPLFIHPSRSSPSIFVPPRPLSHPNSSPPSGNPPAVYLSSNRSNENIPRGPSDLSLEASAASRSIRGLTGEDESKSEPDAVAPPPNSKFETIPEHTTRTSIQELSKGSPPSRPISPLLNDFYPISEKNDIASDTVPANDLRRAPSSSSNEVNIDIEIVSTPSGCDENITFGISSYALAFILDTIPRQLYHYFLLFLPSLYYSRVSRIFIDSRLRVYEIDRCILDEALKKHRLNMPLWRPAKALRRHIDVWSPYDDLEDSWQALTDSFMREWNTLNIISGLLLTERGKDPLIRHSALLSILCALLSLLYGCMYIIRFGIMQKTYKGAEWAYQANKPQIAIFWNVWVMLAMPAAWLGWAILTFIVCIGSFIWRTGTTFDDNLAPHTPHQVLSARVVVSFVLAMGIIYFVLIIVTLREYGDVMDTAWMNRISGWLETAYKQQQQMPEPELLIGPQTQVLRDRIEALRDGTRIVVQEPPQPVAFAHQAVHVPGRKLPPMTYADYALPRDPWWCQGASMHLCMARYVTGL